MNRIMITAILAFFLGADVTYVTAQEKGGTAMEEEAAIGRILENNPKMAHFNENSGEFCVKSPNGGKYMVHFSKNASKTQEGVLLFLEPGPFEGNGFKTGSLPSLPKKLGEMKPYTWYYYDGSYVEPHHNAKIYPYLVMAYNVK